MELKPNFAKVHGPWWTQIKVVLIQKGLLDNQNPGFCMGWPGLYLLLDNIDQLGSVCKAWKISTEDFRVIQVLEVSCFVIIILSQS